MKKIIVMFLLGQCSLLLAANETAEKKRENDLIKFEVSTGVEYTDNRDAMPDKKSNFDLYLTPRLALDLKWEETMLAVSYAPTIRYRTNPSVVENETQIYHNFDLNFTHDLTRNFKVRLLEDFNFTDDPSVQQNGSTLRRDSSFTLSQTEVGLDYLFTRLTKLDMLGRYMVKKYDDAQTATESNMDKTDAGVTFSHQPGKSIALIGTASYSKFGYAKYLGVDRGFDSVYYGAGFEEIFTSDFRISVRGGLQSLNYVDKTIEADNAPYGSISAQITVIPSTRVTASFARATREAFQFPFSSQKSTEFGLRMDWDSPNPDLKFALIGAYLIGDYDSDSVSKELLAKYQTDPTLQAYTSSYGSKTSGTERTSTIAAEVSLKIGVDTKIKFVQSYENVDSDVRWSFNRNSSNLMLTREF